jgi:hypothetical protein
MQHQESNTTFTRHQPTRSSSSHPRPPPCRPPPPQNLVALNFNQEAREADLRYGLVRVRENAESIAFYGGEGSEVGALLTVSLVGGVWCGAAWCRLGVNNS